MIMFCAAVFIVMPVFIIIVCFHCILSLVWHFLLSFVFLVQGFFIEKLASRKKINAMEVKLSK